MTNVKIYLELKKLAKFANLPTVSPTVLPMANIMLINKLYYLLAKLAFFLSFYKYLNNKIKKGNIRKYIEGIENLPILPILPIYRFLI